MKYPGWPVMRRKTDFLHSYVSDLWPKTMNGRLAIDGTRKEEVRSSFVAHEEYVNIHCSYGDEATAEQQQFFSIEVQGISTLDCLLKKYEKSWR